MTPSRPIPSSLRVVAYLYIITGVLSVFEVIQAIFNYRISLNIGIFCVFIGIGLLRLAPRAHTWAKILTFVLNPRTNYNLLVTNKLDYLP